MASLENVLKRLNHKSIGRQKLKSPEIEDQKKKKTVILYLILSTTLVTLASEVT